MSLYYFTFYSNIEVWGTELTKVLCTAVWSLGEGSKSQKLATFWGF